MASRTGLLPAKSSAPGSNIDKRLFRRSIAPAKPIVKTVKPAQSVCHDRRSTPGRFAPTTPDTSRRSIAAKPLSGRRSEGKKLSPGHVKRQVQSKSTSGPSDNRGRTQLKFTPKQKLITPGKKSPAKSILKKADGDASAKKPGDGNNTRHVTFKSKTTAQASMRSKLNEYLASKGKTPSGCRHLMCFDAKVSAKKKQTKLVDRKLSSNLLDGQNKAIEKEVRKNLFHSTMVDENLKENVAPPSPGDPNEFVVPDFLQKEVEKEEALAKSNTPNAGLMEVTPVLGTNLEEVHKNLTSMLEECLNLFKGVGSSERETDLYIDHSLSTY